MQPFHSRHDDLLLPACLQRLQQLAAAVEKAGQSSRTGKLERQLGESLQTLKAGRQEKIVVPTMEGLHYISVDNIVRVAGSANYSTFHLDNGEKVMASKNLKYYEELLPKDTFFRAHQSHLVNLRYIKQIKTLEGNTVELEDGAGIPLAKARKGALMERLKGRS